MPNLALITGASSGIGKEFARYHASKGGDLVITARRDSELNSLKLELEEQYGVKVETYAIDLAADGATKSLYDFVKSTSDPVSILVNNAGFGGHGTHIERPLDQEMGMIDLNVKALVSLTHLVANAMVDNGGGKILQVGSTAGMMPGPYQAVYFATKAFVHSFSQAIDQELRDKGVTCTVLALGFVETEFAQSADLEGTNMVKGKGATAESVAKHGYDAMLQGKLLTVNEKMLSFMTGWLIPLIPRRMVLKNVAKMQTK